MPHRLGWILRLICPGRGVQIKGLGTWDWGLKTHSFTIGVLDCSETECRRYRLVWSSPAPSPSPQPP